MATADGVAGDHRHHRLRTAADLHLQVEHVEVRRSRFVVVAAVVAAHGLVAARAEGLVAGAGEDDDADLTVELRAVHRVDQLLDRFRAEGVALVRPVDRDASDAFGEVVGDVGIVGCGSARLPVEGGTDRGGHVVSLSRRWALPGRGLRGKMAAGEAGCGRGWLREASLPARGWAAPRPWAGQSLPAAAWLAKAMAPARRGPAATGPAAPCVRGAGNSPVDAPGMLN